MSHFVVYVFGENVREQMEPYCESSTELVVTEPVRDFMAKNGIPVSDGEIFDKLKAMTQEEIIVLVSLEDLKYGIGDFYRAGCTLCVTFDGGKLVGVNHLSNQGGKWDWYEVGGRWNRYLIPKEGYSELYEKTTTDGLLEEIRKKLATTPSKEDEVKDVVGANSLPLEGVDWDRMVAEEVAEVLVIYDKYRAVVGDELPPTWEDWLKRECPDQENLSKETYQKASARYGELPGVKFFKDNGYWVLPDWAFCERDQIEELVRNIRLPPFAFVINGEWYEKGRMGWFGMSDNHMTQGEWYQFFMEKMKELDPKTLITVVDCHT